MSSQSTRVIRRPIAGLRPFVKRLWAIDRPFRSGAGLLELVLPTGEMHLAFSLTEAPFRVADDIDGPRRAVGHAVVGGARAAFYVRDLRGPARSVGAQLYPGAGELLFGVGADELAGRHTDLEALWGARAPDLRARLLEASGPERQLDLLESLLAARLPRVRGLHPAVAHALDRFAAASSVRDVVREIGCSHRLLARRFRQSIGLTPKLYCRTLRFRRVLPRVAEAGVCLADLALDAGYSDQPHFTREFREFAGVTPSEYRARRPAHAHHLPLAGASRSARCGHPVA
jgi:AraC-like DNA-binding protein